MSTGLSLAIFLLMVAWSAFFVAAEFALVVARPTRMRQLSEEGNKRATRVLKIQQNPTRFISSIQVAITFSGLVIGAVGEPAVRAMVEDWFGPLTGTLSSRVITVLSIVIGLFIIVSITVVLGEIVPKTLSIARSETIAMAIVAPVGVFTAVIAPFVWLFEALSTLVLRLFGLRGDIRVSTGHSEEELKMILAASYEEGVLEAEETEMLSNVFEFADTEVREVMVPRPDVVGLPANSTVAEAAAIAETHPYTRYPVFGDDLDDIRGVVHIRQLFEASRGGGEEWLNELANPVPKVPETKKLDDMLHDFRRNKSHLAVVVDEYGSLAGVVTLEDLVEEVMGEIDDEFDLPTVNIVQLGNGRILLPGSVPLEEFNERFGTEINDQDFHTVAGAVFDAVGRVPAQGDTATIGGYEFTVLEMDGSRIARLQADRGLTNGRSPDNGASGVDDL